MAQLIEGSLETARRAMSKHAWAQALEIFLEADKAGDLGAADLERMAEAAWWTGKPDLRIDGLERAYAAYLRDGDKVRAAMVAGYLGEFAFDRMAPSVGMAWIERAKRLLEDEPPSAAHGALMVLSAFLAIALQGDFDAGYALADQGQALAKEFGSRDFEALGLNLMGRVLIKKGEVAKGFALLDQSTVAAVGGELGAWAAGNVYCSTIDACRDLADWGRAAEWTEETDRFLRRERITGSYPGICRIHRSEIMRLRGSWPEAEKEARQACRELESMRMLIILGWAHYAVGELRKLQGDFEEADAAFRRAMEFGRDPEPGQSMLRLARGDVDGAAASINRALSPTSGPVALGGDSPNDPLGRAHLLPAQVEIALAVGDRATARHAADELGATAALFGSTALQADAAVARGAVLLDEGDAARALQSLATGYRLWQQVEAPYEAARVRVRVAAAQRALGDDGTARHELEAAKAVFERLNAAPDLTRVEAELERVAAGPARTAPEARATKTFMFTDIVTSTDLLGAIGDQAWEDILNWHDATLRSIFARHGGDEVSHTGDGFFIAFNDPRAAIEAAVDVQRTLATHRREHGFAPSVRIGLHTAEATRRGRNYGGRGVHAAARVGALAERDEILVSRDALQAAGKIANPTSEPRTVELKGIKEPMEVVSIRWS